MRTADAIVEILKREGVSTIFCFPTTPLIENAVAAGIRPIICRQERVVLIWPTVSRGSPMASRLAFS
jgi:thiamine pyrophosphate-dependent acetolactate synthase large subunit-like protein